MAKIVFIGGGSSKFIREIVIDLLQFQELRESQIVLMDIDQQRLDVSEKLVNKIILEMKTYRYRGHSMSDPAKYRTREEVEQVRENRDPIDHFGKKLIQRGVATENDLKMMDNEIKQTVIASAEFATSSPEPGPAELYTDITI